MVMGPLAPAIMRHKAAEFGKSIDDFPHDRIAELVEEISFEIQNPVKKVEFQRAALKLLGDASGQSAVPGESDGQSAPVVGEGVSAGFGDVRRSGARQPPQPKPAGPVERSSRAESKLPVRDGRRASPSEKVEGEQER